MLLFSFVGLLLLRFDACRLLSLLLNDPPRKPRYDPLSSPGRPFTASSSPQHVGPQAVALGVLRVSAPGPHPHRQVGRVAQLVIDLPQHPTIPQVESPHARRPYANPTVGEDNEPCKVHALGRRRQPIIWSAATRRRFGLSRSDGFAVSLSPLSFAFILSPLASKRPEQYTPFSPYVTGDHTKCPTGRTHLPTDSPKPEPTW